MSLVIACILDILILYNDMYPKTEINIICAIILAGGLAGLKGE